MAEHRCHWKRTAQVSPGGRFQTDQKPRGSDWLTDKERLGVLGTGLSLTEDFWWGLLYFIFCRHMWNTVRYLSVYPTLEERYYHDFTVQIRSYFDHVHTLFCDCWRVKKYSIKRQSCHEWLSWIRDSCMTTSVVYKWHVTYIDFGWGFLKIGKCLFQLMSHILAKDMPNVLR